MGVGAALFGTVLSTAASMYMQHKNKPSKPKSAEALEAEAQEESTGRRRKRARDQEQYGKTTFAGANFGMDNLTKTVGG